MQSCHTNAHTESFCSSCRNLTCPSCTALQHYLHLQAGIKHAASGLSCTCICLFLGTAGASRHRRRSCLCIFSIVVALLGSYPLAFVLACTGRLSAEVCGMPGCTGAISCTLCRDYRALEESAQLWLANMKALRLRGESGVSGLRRCATQMLITKQYLAMGKKKCGGWEGLLRGALVVSALALHVAHVCVLWLSFLMMFCNCAL